jgi:hypothetical protein|tara:strand:- start:4002 stop:4253 length:252 start_codon:yes stop_codon:yes gene_type:complete
MKELSQSSIAAAQQFSQSTTSAWTESARRDQYWTLSVLDLMKLAHDPRLPARSVVGVQRAFLGGFVEGYSGLSNGLFGSFHVP